MNKIPEIRSDIVTDSVICGGTTIVTEYAKYPTLLCDFNSDGKADIMQPHAVSGIEANQGAISSAQCDVTYNSRNRPASISQDGWQLQLAYDDGLQRESAVLSHNSAHIETIHYISDDCERETKFLGSRYLDYIRADGRIVAIHVKNGTTDSIYYVQTDLLGSWEKIVDNDRNVVQSSHFDPWGNRMNATDWTLSQDGSSFAFLRGFTGHEHYDRFGIINMNARLYDPVIGRFFSPDPQVQNPFSTQGLNRYTYCGNNPVMYIDEDGEFAWLIPTIVSTVIGIYSGGVLVNNGEHNPLKWDYGSLKTWGYMGAGGIVGFASGYLGGAISTAQIPMANTISLMASSFVNSVGTNLYTGGQTPVSISFGFCSYDITNNVFHTFRKGNPWYVNLGYGLGSMANLADNNLFINNTNVTLYTEKKDLISHTAVVNNDDGSILISYGPNGNDGKTPDTYFGFAFRLRKSTSIYKVYKDLPVTFQANKYIFSVVRNIGKFLPYQGISINCVNMASLSLWLNGIPNIRIHPYLLYTSMWGYANGLRLDLFSQYLTNANN